MPFIGRERELGVLHSMFDRVRAAIGTDRPGQCVLMRGRRRIGKSALAEEFLRRENVPHLFYTAARTSSEEELAELLVGVEECSLPRREVFAEERPGTWTTALRLIADAVDDDSPAIIVIDEVPYLMDRVDSFEGQLQRAWDRYLCRKPILLSLIGSDLSMMEALDSYDRPFHQRGTQMVIGPLNPAEIQDMLALDAASALEAAMVTGGLPLVCGEWPSGAPLWDFLESSLSNPVSALLVSAERSVAAEFPADAAATDILRAIGSEERTFTNIARAAGGVSHSTLGRAVDLLTTKGIVVGELPISLRPSRERRYRISDPYLRFWLRFIQPHMPEIERRRGDLTLKRIRTSWAAWRGRAIEPLVRDALARRLPDQILPAAPAIGGYWTRSNDVEIDIVGADRAPVAREIFFLGSVKWLENSPFDSHDLAPLAYHRSRLTDAPVPLLAVSRSGVTSRDLDAAYGPDEIVESWR